METGDLFDGVLECLDDLFGMFLLTLKKSNISRIFRTVAGKMIFLFGHRWHMLYSSQQSTISGKLSGICFVFLPLETELKLLFLSCCFSGPM